MKATQVILLTTIIVTALTWQGCNRDPEIDEPQPPQTKINIAVLAGNGNVGATDGPVASAEFDRPTGLYAGVDGKIYVADLGNNRVRVISANGKVTTAAGKDPGFADGPANTARFYQPHDVAVDKDGNVYVTDLTNNRIRKVNAAGEVSTFVNIQTPNYIAIDPSGNLYVTDVNIYKVSRITPDGVVTIVVTRGEQGSLDENGNGLNFELPLQGIATDQQGNVYFVDPANRRIRKITPAGVVTTYAGGWFGQQDGEALKAKFDDLQAVAVDKAGNVFVTDNKSIRVISTDGIVSTVIQQRDDGDLAFRWPYDLAFDTNDVLYIADVERQKIFKAFVVRD